MGSEMCIRDRQSADATAGHADGVPLFQIPLLFVGKLLKRRRDRLCLNPVPENIGIVPAIVARHILTGFFAVLVLLRAVPVKSPLLRASCCAVTAPKALLPIRSLWALRGLLTSCPRRSYWTIIFTPAPCVRCRPATARSAA